MPRIKIWPFGDRGQGGSRSCFFLLRSGTCGCRLFRPSLLLLLSVALAACATQPQLSPQDKGQPRARMAGKTGAPTVENKLWVAEGGVAPVPLYPPIRLQDTREVRGYLHQLTTEHSQFIRDSLSRRQQYIAMIEETFGSRGLPLELSNVAMIESRFVADAESSQGATGLWQLIKPTAQGMGLTVNILRDEREDPAKSTVAAAKYFTRLFDRFGDWLLVIAAYNAGPGRVKDAIEKCDTKAFFELARCPNSGLRQETKDFVAKFVAVTLITRNLDLYGFEDQRLKYFIEER